jgi:plastocyanin
VTWRVYDKNNSQVGSPHAMTLQPYGVVAPGGLAGYADGGAGADLSDAWLSYTSDQPIVAYGSVIDNGTTDPTYIPAAEDTGVTSVTTPAGKIISVTTRSQPSSAIDISPAIIPGSISPGDTVTFRVSGRDDTHGFRIVDPDGATILLDLVVTPGAPATDHTIQLVTQGTYLYYCTITTCSAGHANMQGTFVVGKASDPPPRY